MFQQLIGKTRALIARFGSAELAKMGAAMAVGALLWAVVGTGMAPPAAAATDPYHWEETADESPGSPRWFARAAISAADGDLARAERQLQRALAQVRAAVPRQ